MPRKKASSNNVDKFNHPEYNSQNHLKNVEETEDLGDNYLSDYDKYAEGIRVLSSLGYTFIPHSNPDCVGHRVYVDTPFTLISKDGKTIYILPVRGNGLWDAIWGYIALDDDLKSISGVYFDHKGETPGLGANITETFFTDDFKGEFLYDASGNFKGVEISKSNADPNNEDKKDNQVDAISGATITGNGVGAMINSGIRSYLPYFETLKK